GRAVEGLGLEAALADPRRHHVAVVEDEAAGHGSDLHDESIISGLDAPWELVEQLGVPHAVRGVGEVRAFRAYGARGLHRLLDREVRGVRAPEPERVEHEDADAAERGDRFWREALGV